MFGVLSLLLIVSCSLFDISCVLVVVCCLLCLFVACWLL